MFDTEKPSDRKTQNHISENNNLLKSLAGFFSGTSSTHRYSTIYINYVDGGDGHDDM
jgi:hypothetical protein